jgi:23S rRNA maturation-related 3'-5' exoribonuclease YhaM
MKDISVLVSGVREKAERLIEKQILLEGKNEKLSNEIDQVKLELTEKNLQVLALNDRVKLLKIAGSVGGEESTKEVKLKINEMVREIDKCIAQINR